MAKRRAKKKRAAAGAKFDIVVFHETGSTICVVIPGTRDLELGDKVIWHNRTGAAMTVLFPWDSLDTPRGFTKTIQDAKEHQSGGATRTGPFRYQIWCDETSNFAQGSDPEIIVS